jgi:hypothetical protein
VGGGLAERQGRDVDPRGLAEVHGGVDLGVAGGWEGVERGLVKGAIFGFALDPAPSIYLKNKK